MNLNTWFQERYFQKSLPGRNAIGRAARALPTRWTLGSVYHKTCAEIRSTEKKSPEWLTAYQHKLLGGVLADAQRDVPFYHDLFGRCGVDVRADDITAELLKLPLIDKETITREGLPRFTSRRYHPRDLVTSFTGGTTADSPMRLLADRDVTRQREQAFMHHMINRVGVVFGERNLLLKVDTDKGWKEYDGFKNRLLVSQSRLDATTLDEYLRAIERFGPKHLNALPSTAYLFVRLLQEHGRRLRTRFKSVLLCSEIVHDYQRRAIEQQLETRVFSWYGHNERCVLAGESKSDANVYYVFPQYGYLEIVDEQGRRIEKPDVVGEIVSTGFNNNAMPLIRYATGDYAAWADPTEHTDLPYSSIHRIEGREQDFVLTEDGRRFSLVPILFQIHDDFWIHIRDIQFYQAVPGKLTARVVPAVDKPIDAVRERVWSALRPNINPDIEFDVEPIRREEVVLTKRGKKRLLIHGHNNNVSKTLVAPWADGS